MMGVFGILKERPRTDKELQLFEDLRGALVRAVNDGSGGVSPVEAINAAVNLLGFVVINSGAHLGNADGLCQQIAAHLKKIIESYAQEESH